MLKVELETLLEKGFSTRQIAVEFKCSQTNIVYWLKKYKLSTDCDYFVEGDLFKTCPKCNTSKEVSDFSVRKTRGNKPAGYCKECDSKADLIKRRKSKLKFLEYKGGSCEKCGYSKCQAALEFHHLDPNKKDFSLSKKRTLNKETKNELDKCVLLCSNCHREEHTRLTNSQHQLRYRGDGI